jgi:hypothetical protein
MADPAIAPENFSFKSATTQTSAQLNDLTAGDVLRVYVRKKTANLTGKPSEIFQCETPVSDFAILEPKIIDKDTLEIIWKDNLFTQGESYQLFANSEYVSSSTSGMTKLISVTGGLNYVFVVKKFDVSNSFLRETLPREFLMPLPPVAITETPVLEKQTFDRGTLKWVDNTNTGVMYQVAWNEGNSEIIQTENFVVLEMQADKSRSFDIEFGKTYRFAVKVIAYSILESDYSPVFEYVSGDAPSPVLVGPLTVSGNTTATLFWNDPDNNSSSNYLVTYQTLDQQGEVSGESVQVGSVAYPEASIDIDGLLFGQNYLYTVTKSIDSYVASSTFTAQFPEQPLLPSDFFVSAEVKSESSVRLYWSDSNHVPAENYVIKKDGQEIDRVSLNQALISGLAQGIEYAFTITKINLETGMTSLESQETKVVIPATPSPIDGEISVVPVLMLTGNIVWSDSNKQENEEYVIYWNNSLDGTISATPDFEIGATQNCNFLLEGVEPNINYSVAISKRISAVPEIESIKKEYSFVCPTPVINLSCHSITVNSGYLQWEWNLPGNAIFNFKEFRVYFDGGDPSLAFENFSLIENGIISNVNLRSANYSLSSDSEYRFMVKVVTTDNISDFIFNNGQGGNIVALNTQPVPPVELSTFSFEVSKDTYGRIVSYNQDEGFSNNIKINWEYSSPELITGYSVYTNAIAGALIDDMMPPYFVPNPSLLTSILPGGINRYRVHPRKSPSDAESDIGTEYDVDVPFEPSPVTFNEPEIIKDSETNQLSGIKISWNSVSSNVKHYLFYSDEAVPEAFTGNYVEAGTSNEYIFTPNDGQVSFGSTYFVKVGTVEKTFGLSASTTDIFMFSVPAKPMPPSVPGYTIEIDEKGLYQALVLNWTPMNDVSTLSTFIIYSNLGNGTALTKIADVAVENAKWDYAFQLTSTQLTIDTPYIFAVSVVSSNGIESDKVQVDVCIHSTAAPNPIVAETYCDPDTGYYEGVKLSWDLVENEYLNCYRIYRVSVDGAQILGDSITSLAKEVTSTVIKDLPYGTEQRFAIRTVSTDFIENQTTFFSNVISVPAAAPKVTNLQIVPSIGPDNVRRFDKLHISWNVSENTDRVFLYIKMDSLNVTPYPAELAANEQSFELTPEENRTYSVNIRVLSTDKVLDPDGVDSEYIVPDLPVPLYAYQITILPIKDDGIYVQPQISWEGYIPADNIAGYNIYSDNGTGTLNFSSLLAHVDGKDILSFNIPDQGLEFNKLYSFVVRAVTTENVEDSGASIKSFYKKPAPLPVTNFDYQVEKENGYYSSIKLVWDAADSNIGAFRIYWDAGQGIIRTEPVCKIDNGFAREITIDKELSFDTTYQFEIKTLNSIGIEAEPGVIVSLRLSRPTLPESFASKAYVADRFSGVTLSWGSTVEECDYLVYWDNASGAIDFSTPMTLLGSDVSSYIHQDEKVGFTYKYALKTRSAQGVLSSEYLETSFRVDAPAPVSWSEDFYNAEKNESGFFSGVNINWNHSADVDKQWYLIFFNDGSGALDFDEPLTKLSADINTYSFLDIVPGTDYKIAIQTIDANGVCDGTTVEKSFRFDYPRSVENFSYAYVCNEEGMLSAVNLSWNIYQAEQVSKLLLFVGTTSEVDLNSPTSVIDSSTGFKTLAIGSDLILGNKYYISIRVVDVNGIVDTTSSNLSFDLSYPETVNGFTYSFTDDGNENITSFKLLWNPLLNISEYRIYWNEGSEAEAIKLLAKITEPSQGEYIVNEPIIAKTNYIFAIETFNNIGIVSAQRAEQSINISFEAPHLFLDGLAVNNKVTLKWDYEAADFAGFKIYCSDQTEIDYNQPTAIIGKDERTYILSSLSLYKEYCCAVVPYTNASTELEKSNVLVFDTKVPDVPNNMMCYLNHSDQIVISWTAPELTDCLAGYRIYFDSVTGVIDYCTPLASVSNDVTQHIIDGFDISKVYRFNIRSRNSYGFEYPTTRPIESTVNTDYSIMFAGIKCTTYLGNSFWFKTEKDNIEICNKKLEDLDIPECNRLYYDDKQEFLVLLYKAQNILKLVVVTKEGDILEPVVLGKLAYPDCNSPLRDASGVNSRTLITSNFYSNSNYVRFYSIDEKVFLRFRTEFLDDQGVIWKCIGPAKMRLFRFLPDSHFRTV